MSREGIITNQNTEKVEKEISDRLREIFGYKISAKEKPILQRMIKAYMVNKTNAFYQQTKELQKLDMISVIEKVRADSKAEMILYDSLVEHRIPFKFQYEIGPYRADYLIKDSFVLELDGPEHNQEHDVKRDNYLMKMGYNIVRIPLWALIASPESIIESIKEII